MTELNLYKFITESNIEWHRQDNDGTPDIIIFVPHYEIEDFSKLVKSYTSDEGLACRMRDGYFAFWMQDVCDHYGIDSKNVFCGEEQ